MFVSVLKRLSSLLSVILIQPLLIWTEVQFKTLTQSSGGVKDAADTSDLELLMDSDVQKHKHVSFLCWCQTQKHLSVNSALKSESFLTG